jgi:hypothetical protein
VLALGLLVVLACQSSPSAPPSLSGFEAATNKEELSRWIGRRAERCFFSRPGWEVCVWVVGNRLPGWVALSASVGSDNRLHVLCELQVSRAPRGPDSCDVIALGRQEIRVDPARARAALERARTVAAISRLVGDAPRQCRRISEGMRRCTWHASNVIPGYPTLSALAYTDRRVDLVCRIPIDGGERAPRSCEAAQAR